jgi:Predicted membrane protein (DUF2142)
MQDPPLANDGPSGSARSLVDSTMFSSQALGSELPRRSRRLSGPMRTVAVTLGIFLMSTAYALAAPLGSPPDEPEHWRYAWGALTGQDVATGEVTVPRSLTGYPGACFNESPEVGASCADEITPDPEQVASGTSALLYPTLYYRLVGWPLLLSPAETGLLGARVVSAAVVAIVWGVAFAPWLGRSAWLMRASLLLAVTPSALYFAGMISPQGLELASLAAVWSLTVTVFLGLRRGLYRDLPVWVQLAWPAISMVACLTRVLSWWWVLVAVAACWVALRPPLRRDRRAWLALAIVGVAIVSRAVVFLLRSLSFEVS